MATIAIAVRFKGFGAIVAGKTEFLAFLVIFHFDLRCAFFLFENFGMAIVALQAFGGVKLSRKHHLAHGAFCEFHFHTRRYGTGQGIKADC